VQGGDATPAPALARAAVTADELLAQVVDLDSRNGGHGEHLIGYAGGLVATPRRADEQDAFGLGGGAGAPDVLGATTDRSTAAPVGCCIYRKSISDIDIGWHEVEDAPSSSTEGFV
jgi:hypothetical protein